MRFAKLAHLDGLVNGLGSWELGSGACVRFLVIHLLSYSSHRSELPTPNYFKSETIF
jgi:hypothetical protein